MPKNQKKKYKYFFLVAIFFASSFFLLAPEMAYARSVGQFVGDAFSLPFTLLLYAVLWVLGVFLSVAVSLFGYVVDAAHFQQLFNLPAVYEMWKFIRDFFNLFFILTLLYIAFTIIFQIASDYKKTLLSLVLAALFINFSFPITRALIDVVNVPMYFFINQAVPAKDINSPEKMLGTVLSASSIKDVLIPTGYDIVGNTFARYFMSIIVMFLMSISLLVIAVMLLIRILALFLLVIFSSIGFAGAVIPGMQKYSSMWWENFTKYALFGPASMLMLLISIRILDSLQKSGFSESMSGSVRRNVTADDITTVTALATYLVPIILLWFTIGLAQTMSLAGAGAVVGTGQKFSKWAGKLPVRGTWAGAKFGGRKYEKWVVGKGDAGKYLSPTALMSSWKAWRDESQHQDKAPVERGAAAIQDRLNAAFGDHTDHAFAVTRKQSSEQEKHITATSNDEDYISHEVLNAVNNGQPDLAAGGLNALAKGNGLNTFLLQAAQQDRYKNMKDKNGNDLLTKDVDGNAEVSSENMRRLLKQILVDSGEKDENMIVKQLMAISETATASGNYAFGGMAVYDGHGGFRLAQEYKKGDINPDNGKVRDRDGDEQGDWASGKVKNLESQERQRKIHPDSLFKRTEAGFGDLNDEVANSVIKTFTYADVSQVDRSRDDLKEAIHKAYENFDKNPKFKKLYNENEIFKQYVTSVVKLKRGKKKDDKDDKWEAANGPGTKYVETAVPDADGGTPAPAPKREKNAKEAADERAAKRRNKH